VLPLTPAGVIPKSTRPPAGFEAPPGDLRPDAIGAGAFVPFFIFTPDSGYTPIAASNC
jgi:hypothetical protein